MAKWKVSFEKLQRGQKEQGLLLNPSNQIKTDNRGQAELGNLREDMEKFKSKKQAHKVYLARTMAAATRRKKTQTKLYLLQAIFDCLDPNITYKLLTDFEAKGRTEAVIKLMLSCEILYRAMTDEFDVCTSEAFRMSVKH